MLKEFLFHPALFVFTWMQTRLYILTDQDVMTQLFSGIDII